MQPSYAEHHSLVRPPREDDRKAVFRRDEFKLYVPLVELREPLPTTILVELFFPWALENNKPENDSKDTIDVVVQKKRPDRQAVNSVVYAPIGDPKTWKIGKPYIPHKILDHSAPEYVFVRVRY